MTTTERIIHQFRNDLHCHKAAILALIALCAVSVICEFFYQNLFQLNATFALALVILTAGILTILIVASCMINDPPVGENAFWMTRPLRGREMAASKLLMVGLVYLPLLLAWLALPLVHFGLSESVHYLRGYWKITTPLLAATIAAAAFSNRLSTFVTVFIVLFGGAAALVALAVQTSTLTLRMDWTPQQRETGLIIAQIIFLTGAVTFAVLQYLRGYRHTHTAVLGVFLITGALAYAYLRIDLVTRRIGEKEERTLGLSETEMKITGSLNTQRIEHQYGDNRPVLYSELRTPVSFDKLPGNIAVDSLLIRDAKLSTEKETSSNDATLDSYLHNRQAYDLFKSALPDYEFHVSNSPHQQLQLRLYRQTDLNYQRFSGKTADYHGNAAVKLAAYESIGSLPFGQDGILKGPGYYFEISSSAKENGNADCWLNGWMRNHFQPPHHGPVRLFPVVALINTKEKQAVLSSGSGGGGGSSGRFTHRQMSHSFSRGFYHKLVDDEWVRSELKITNEWLAKAEIVLFVKKELGTIERRIDLKGIQLPE